jgi:hypothetical protein
MSSPGAPASGSMFNIESTDASNGEPVKLRRSIRLLKLGSVSRRRAAKDQKAKKAKKSEKVKLRREINLQDALMVPSTELEETKTLREELMKKNLEDLNRQLVTQVDSFRRALICKERENEALRSVDRQQFNTIRQLKLQAGEYERRAKTDQAEIENLRGVLALSERQLSDAKCNIETLQHQIDTQDAEF